ncbi:MAG: hypothetical protein AAGI46_12165, partial [Planctomycetota bacterium]
MQNHPRPAVRRLRLAAAAALATAGLAATAPAQVTWIGGATGDWSDNANWDSAVFPNGTTIDAIIAGLVEVTVEPGITRDVRSLSVSSASQFFISDNTFFDINNGGLANAGFVTVTSTGGNTQLRFAGTNDITGGGTILLEDGIIGGTSSVITNVDNLITGTGNIGNNAARFSNEATIQAQGGTLVLDPASVIGGPEFFNTGTLAANGAGSVLVLTGNGFGEFSNVGGNISAINGVVRLTSGADILGGTYSTSGTGVIEVAASSSAILQYATNTGNMVARFGSDLEIRGSTFTNSGSITIDSSGGARADLQLLNGNNIELNGTGTLNLVDGGINGSGFLVVGADQTVRGSGFVGQNQIRIENFGTIRGDVNGGDLEINPAAVTAGAEFFNPGLVRASNGGSVTLSGQGNGEFANTDRLGNGSGVMEAVGAGSELVLDDDAVIIGGTLRGIDGGIVRAAADQNIDVTNVTLEGAHTVDDNTDYNTTGTINLASGSTLTLTSTGSATDLEMSGSVDFVGSGQIVLADPLSGVDGSGTMNLGGDVTLRGQGRLGQNDIRIFNEGTILGDVNGGNLVIDPASLDGNAEFFNTGLVRAVGGGTVTLDGLSNGEFTNTDELGAGSGIMEASGSGSEIVLTNTARVFNGTLRGVSGGLVRTGDNENVFITNVLLQGNHVVGNNSDYGIDGTVTLDAGGTLRLQAGAQATDLEIQSTATLDGNGTVILEGSLAGINGSGDFNIGSGITIRGEGRFGQNAIRIFNEGTILADVDGGTLSLDPNSVDANAEFINTGVARAINGGTLQLSGASNGEFNNTGALIEAVGAGSEVNLTSNARLFGGTLRSTGGGTVEVGDGENVFLTDVLVEGVLNVGSNTDLGIDGTVVNDGTITLDGTGAQTDLEVQSSAIFAGSGELVLDGPSAGINGSGTLLNDSGNTIRGEGNVGRNAIQITNDGFIIADVAGQELVLNPASVIAGPEFINNGTLLATDGGILVFDGQGSGEFLNNNEITVANGGQILFRNGADLTNANAAASDRLIGGTFRVFDDGSGTTFDIVPPDFDLETIEFATVEIQGPNVTSNLFDDTASATGDLVGFKFRENGGTFTIGGGTDLTVTVGEGDTPGIAAFANSFDDGLGNPDSLNAGTFFVDAGSTVTFLGQFDGGSPFTNNFANGGDSVLGGGGTLVANVNGNGIYRPGNSDGTVGTLNVDNSATSSISSARLEVDLFDQNVNDVLAFGGNLFANDLDIAVDLAGGFLPNPGDDFTVLTSGGSLTASSPNAFEVAGLPGLLFTTLVTSSDLILTADNAIDGDFNYDGTVDLADFGILRAGFGSGDEYVLGDANQDGTVDLADFGILRA